MSLYRKFSHQAESYGHSARVFRAIYEKAEPRRQFLDALRWVDQIYADRGCSAAGSFMIDAFLNPLVKNQGHKLDAKFLREVFGYYLDYTNFVATEETGLHVPSSSGSTADPWRKILEAFGDLGWDSKAGIFTEIVGRSPDSSRLWIYPKLGGLLTLSGPARMLRALFMECVINEGSTEHEGHNTDNMSVEGQHAFWKMIAAEAKKTAHQET